jgi:CIC family chloride channel protein
VERRSLDLMRFGGAVLVVAIGAALFAVVFRALLAGIYREGYGAANIVDAITGLPRWGRLLAPSAAGVIAGCLSLLWARRRQGVSNVMEAVALGRVRLSLRTTLARVSSSFVAIAGGISIGREGPLIEFGGTLAAAVGRFNHLPLARLRTLVAAGTAAGFAAAYNTPFAAVLFVLETIVGVAALEALVPIIAATVVATTITRAVVGGGPIYGQRAFALTSSWEFISFALVGVIGGGGGVLFKTVLRWMEGVVKRADWPQPLRSAAGGVVVGVIAVALPQVVGNGYEPLNRILDGDAMPLLLLFVLIAKVLATSASVASGIPGGIFTPSLLVGGILGVEWAHALTRLSFGIGDAGGYALVGMAAVTAATIHAPLTAAVLVFELSGDYAIALPLLLATAIATTISRACRSDSVYESELAGRGLRWRVTLEGREVRQDQVRL